MIQCSAAPTKRAPLYTRRLIVVAMVTRCGVFSAVTNAQSLGPQEKQVGSRSLNQQLQSLVLPNVEIHHADLAGALEYLTRKAAEQSGGKVQLVYSSLIADAAVTAKVTLNLQSIPFLEALRYTGELAGVTLSVENEKIVVKTRDDTPAKVRATADEPAHGEVPLPLTRGLHGTLGESAEPVKSGVRNAYRNIDGNVQISKSGSIARRSLGGWPVVIDPTNKIDVNCSERGASCRAAVHSPLCLSRAASQAAGGRK